MGVKKNKFIFVNVAASFFLFFLIILVFIPKGMKMIEDRKKNSLLKKGNYLIEEVLKKDSQEKRIYTYLNKKETSKEQLNYKKFIPEEGKIIINEKGNLALALYHNKYCLEKDFLEKSLKISKKTKEKCRLPYIDNSDAFYPVLKENMFPVIFQDNNWLKANLNEKWYDYQKGEWANVVLVSELAREYYREAEPLTVINDFDILAHFVWLPRYKYKLFNVEGLAVKEQSIEIVFEAVLDKKSQGQNNGEWLTHPAFTFGDEELKGLWIGKFQTTGRRSKPTIKPNMDILVYQNLGSQFEIAQRFNDYKVYGLEVNTEAHMMKNIEWGAVAYLSHSKYGKNKEIWVNPSKDFITGCAGSYVSSPLQEGCPHDYPSLKGKEASTTGNVYGLYDMSGGTAEYVMGGLYNKEETELKLSLATFKNINDHQLNKFIDKYSHGSTSDNQKAYNRRLLGDATSETRGWYQDSSVFIKSELTDTQYGNFWFIRGGYYNDQEKAGIFSFSSQDGGATSYNGFRVVLPGKMERKQE